MNNALLQFTHVIELALEWCILVLELMGVIVIIVAGLHAFYQYAKRNSTVRLQFAQSMAMGLEFILAGEILRTVQVRELKEIIIVGAIIALRAVLNFLIQLEIRQERKLRLSDKGPAHPGASSVKKSVDHDVSVDDEGYQEDDSSYREEHG